MTRGVAYQSRLISKLKQLSLKHKVFFYHLPRKSSLIWVLIMRSEDEFQFEENMIKAACTKKYESYGYVCCIQWLPRSILYFCLDRLIHHKSKSSYTRISELALNWAAPSNQRSNNSSQGLQLHILFQCLDCNAPKSHSVEPSQSICSLWSSHRRYD